VISDHSVISVGSDAESCITTLKKEDLLIDYFSSRHLHHVLSANLV